MGRKVVFSVTLMIHFYSNRGDGDSIQKQRDLVEVKILDRRPAYSKLLCPYLFFSLFLSPLFLFPPVSFSVVAHLCLYLITSLSLFLTLSNSATLCLSSSFLLLLCLFFRLSFSFFSCLLLPLS